MPTSMMLPIAERMDTMGFHAIDLMAAVTFDVCVRYLREDPWQRIRLMAARVRRTPLNGWVRSKSLISFDLVADDVIELWVQRLAANGLRRVTCFDAWHTAISPLANGPSLPPTERIVDFARRLDRRVTVDAEGLATMAAYFREAARAAGKPLGRAVEYDPFHYRHQVPGGMMTNLRAQLAAAGLEARLDEILEEIARVREELGWLNMVTPTSQLVATQAVLNVVQGERYRTIPTEVVK